MKYRPPPPRRCPGDRRRRCDQRPDESPWLQNLIVGGDQWLLNYTPHLYQAAGCLPIRDYTHAALVGDLKTAVEIAQSLNPIRAVLALGERLWPRDRPAARARAESLDELLGMTGGPVRAPVTPMSEEAKRQLRDELAATGILDQVKTVPRNAA